MFLQSMFCQIVFVQRVQKVVSEFLQNYQFGNFLGSWSEISGKKNDSCRDLNSAPDNKYHERIVVKLAGAGTTVVSQRRVHAFRRVLYIFVHARRFGQ